jgi:hypothetical protein
MATAPLIRTDLSKADCYDRYAFQDADVLLVHRECHWYRFWDLGQDVSWRIQADTHSPWNHTGLLFWDQVSQQWMVVEALWHVAATPLASYMQPGVYTLGFRRAPGGLTPQQQALARVRAYAQVGDGYNWEMCLRIRWEQLLHGYSGVGLPAMMEAVKNDPGVWICSQLVLWVLAEAGHGLGLGLWASPADVGSKTVAASPVSAWPKTRCLASMVYAGRHWTA